MKYSSLNLPNQAVNFKLTFENTSPANGGAITPPWFGFDDGSFDTLKIEDKASSGDRIAEGIQDLDGNDTLIEIKIS